MKYKLLILSLFVSIVGFSQKFYPAIRNDSLFIIWELTPGNWIERYCPTDTTIEIPFANHWFTQDSMRKNIYNKFTNFIADNTTEPGRNLLNISTPASSSVPVLLSNGNVTTRNTSDFKSDLALDQVNNTSDANKPVSTAQQTALNNKSTIYVGLDAGANDSYVITASPVPTSYTQGMVVIFRANTQNTTGCTINVNGLGVKTIVKRVSTTPATGDILALMWRWLVYDGTNFVLMNPVVN